MSADKPVEGQEPEAVEAAKVSNEGSFDPWEKFPAEFNWVRKELDGAREEAAKKRVEAKELRDKLAVAKTPEEVQQITADYDSKLAAAEVAARRATAARKASLPEGLDEFITGSTDEEIATQVAKLAGLKPADKADDVEPVVITQPAPTGGLTPTAGAQEASGREEWIKYRNAR